MILHEVGELLRAAEQEAVLLCGSLRRGLADPFREVPDEGQGYSHVE